MEADGLTDGLTLEDGEGLGLSLDDGLTDALGETEAEGLRLGLTEEEPAAPRSVTEKLSISVVLFASSVDVTSSAPPPAPIPALPAALRSLSVADATSTVSSNNLRAVPMIWSLQTEPVAMVTALPRAVHVPDTFLYNWQPLATFDMRTAYMFSMSASRTKI